MISNLRPDVLLTIALESVATVCLLVVQILKYAKMKRVRETGDGLTLGYSAEIE